MVSASATPTAIGRPDMLCSGPLKRQASENISAAPGADSQLRPARPRPAVWLPAMRSTGPASVSMRASRSALVEPVSATVSIATCEALVAQLARMASASRVFMMRPCVVCAALC